MRRRYRKTTAQKSLRKQLIFPAAHTLYPEFQNFHPEIINPFFSFKVSSLDFNASIVASF